MEFEVFIDKWEHNTDKGISFPLDMRETENYLKKLDGKISTQILVIPSNRATNLLIGGGNNGLYVVTYTVGSDEQFFNLVASNKDGSNEVELVTGGQAGLFMDKYCVTFEVVLEAFIHYAKTGERSPTLIWEES